MFAAVRYGSTGRSPITSAGGMAPPLPVSPHVRRFAMNARWIALAIALVGMQLGLAGDWPQWRGPNRDAKAADFKAPAKWPEKLAEKWKVTVGDGVATPALVG